MEQKIMSFFARTPIHVGAGNSVGAIDSPIARERHTRIPILPGSALKGVLSDMWSENSDRTEKETLFGTEKQAGGLLIGEARVLAFPLRSARGAFAWITCPLALERFNRDSGRHLSIPKLTPDKQNEMFCAAGDQILAEKNSVVLEEYVFTQNSNGKSALDEIEKTFLDLSDDPVWKELLPGHLAMISNEMFSYFVENACEVVTRVRIDDEKGIVANGALFNQEQLPSETLLYSVIGWQKKKENAPWTDLENKFTANAGQLQIGGDETIGLGCCSIKLEKQAEGGN